MLKVKPQHRFWFRCRKKGGCGQYRTAREVFRKFLTPWLRRRLDNFLANDPAAAGAILEFDNGCPRCRQLLVSRARVIKVRIRNGRTEKMERPS